jgi:hypothetical protein
MMTRADWWLGVVLLLAAIVLHAALPHYEWMLTGNPQGQQIMIKMDRWTGESYVTYPKAPEAPK